MKQGISVCFPFVFFSCSQSGKFTINFLVIKDIFKLKAYITTTISRFLQFPALLEAHSQKLFFLDLPMTTLKEARQPNERMQWIGTWQQVQVWQGTWLWSRFGVYPDPIDHEWMESVNRPKATVHQNICDENQVFTALPKTQSPLAGAGKKISFLPVTYFPPLLKEILHTHRYPQNTTSSFLPGIGRPKGHPHL